MLTPQELQSLRNMGNECEAAASEIDRLRAALRGLMKCESGIYCDSYPEAMKAAQSAMRNFESWLDDRSGPLLHIDDVRDAMGRAEDSEQMHTHLGCAPSPLSDLEITQIELRLRKYSDYDCYDLSLTEFARAIENAHGIN